MGGMEIRTAIVGGSGYTGEELLRLVYLHPDLELEVVTANSEAGNLVSSLYKNLSCYSDFRFLDFKSALNRINECELAFIALPHGESSKIANFLKNKVIIDLSSDFRLKDSSCYPKWYKRESLANDEELSNWVYGLPELFKEEISKSSKIANPGCYATSIILPLAPLFKEDLIEDLVIVNSISGASGAGKMPTNILHLPSLYENISAYKIGCHQHTPEIEQALKIYSSKDVKISMTPHLAPMSRGIHSTCSSKLIKNISIDKIYELFHLTYKDEPFVKICDYPPSSKEVRGSNFIHIHLSIDKRNNRIITTSVIDNLVKGASGQAIQNANIAFNIKEETAINQMGIYP